MIVPMFGFREFENSISIINVQNIFFHFQYPLMFPKIVNGNREFDQNQPTWKQHKTAYGSSTKLENHATVGGCQQHLENFWTSSIKMNVAINSF